MSDGYNKELYGKLVKSRKSSRKKEMIYGLGQTVLGSLPWLIRLKQDSDRRKESMLAANNLAAQNPELGIHPSGVTPEMAGALAEMAMRSRMAKQARTDEGTEWNRREGVEHTNRLAEIRAGDEWRTGGGAVPMGNVPEQFQGQFGEQLPVHSETASIWNKMIEPTAGTQPQTEAQITAARRAQLTSDPKYWLQQDVTRLRTLGYDPEMPGFRRPADVPLGAGQYQLPEDIAADTQKMLTNRKDMAEIASREGVAQAANKRSLLQSILESSGLWTPPVGKEGVPALMDTIWQNVGTGGFPHLAPSPIQNPVAPSPTDHASRPRDSRVVQMYNRIKMENPDGLPAWLNEMKAAGYDVAGLE